MSEVSLYGAGSRQRRRLGGGCPYTLQGYLAHKKTSSPGTLQQDYVQGPMVVLEVGAFSYERGTPVNPKRLPPIP